MEIIEGNLYFIKDKFIEKYNPKYHLMENKETGISVKVPKAVKEEIDKKTRDIFALTNRGIIATFTNLPEFIKDIRQELE